jgi:hypothetical protein
MSDATLAEKMPVSLWSGDGETGSVAGFQRCLLCTRIGKSLKGDSAPLGLGGFENGAKLLGTTPMAVGNAKVRGFSGARRAGS